MKLSILGLGAWGIALAQRYAPRFDVHIWGRDAQKVHTLIQDLRHPAWPELPLDASIQASSNLHDVLMDADMIMLATPSHALETMADQLKKHAIMHLTHVLNQTKKRPALILLSKGLQEKNGVIAWPLTFLQQELSQWYACYVLTGPSFAKEVAQGLPCALTLAGDAAGLPYVQNQLHGAHMRIYRSDDAIGCQMGGAFKNIIAIACGITAGLGLGLNAQAALMTRGLHEMLAIGQFLGAKAETLYGLAGLGDLILTAGGDLSRNRTFGEAIVKLKNIDAALSSVGHVVEGWYATRLFYQWCQNAPEMHAHIPNLPPTLA